MAGTPVRPAHKKDRSFRADHCRVPATEVVMMDRIYSNEEKEVPLFLIPHAIARQIRKTGDRIYRISVKRTHYHHYNVSVRTKTQPRELFPESSPEASPDITGIPGSPGLLTCKSGASA
jgi:hypothetical protein